MCTSKFFAGALIGLVTGLLIAPEKGEDLRSEIADKAEDVKKRLYRIAGKTSTELADLKKILSNEIDGLGDDVRAHMLTIINETAERTNNIKKNIGKEIHS